ncbi:MAG: hypothetical protein RBT75_21740, partial [Anaerolineae bacterium]|nr:hypothetical protein [Anaerolineae bacterium]
MERVHWSFRIQVTLALILALIMAFNSPGSELALAASNNNDVEWLGAGHLPGINICGDATYPYRNPTNPRANQAVTLRARSFKGDLTGITIWYTTNSAAAVEGDWTSVAAVWTNNWGGCGGLGDMDIWAGTIPAQTTQVWYKIAYTDGTDTDWHRGSGEGVTGMYDNEGGW